MYVSPNKKNEVMFLEQFGTGVLVDDGGLPTLEVFFPDEMVEQYILASCDDLKAFNTGLFSLLLYLDERAVLTEHEYIPSGKNYIMGWHKLSAIDAYKIIQEFEKSWSPGSTSPKISFSWKLRKPEFIHELEMEGGQYVHPSSINTSLDV